MTISLERLEICHSLISFVRFSREFVLRNFIEIRQTLRACGAVQISPPAEDLSWMCDWENHEVESRPVRFANLVQMNRHFTGALLS